jgi:hypothetical protein
MLQNQESPSSFAENRCNLQPFGKVLVGRDRALYPKTHDPPKYRPRSLAMLTSSNGMGSPWQNSCMALAIYCPTPGSVSISRLSLGNPPFRRTISLASPKSDSALRRHKPIGFMNEPISLSGADGSDFQQGNLWTKTGKNDATVSALVRCRSTSDTTFL